MTTATITVSRSALRENLRAVRDRVRPAELMAVVKDDAYGHGLDEVVRLLADEGVGWFGALDLETAMRVRVLAPDARVFAWVLSAGDDLAAAVAAGVDVGATDLATLERAASAAGPARVHLKIDSGLHRAGVLPGDWPGFVRRAAELQGAGRIEVAGLWTHIAEASERSDSVSIALFERAVAEARSAGLSGGARHLAASAASSARADSRFDLVRVGAFLYGIAPGGGVGPAEIGIRPAMTLSASVVAVDRGDGTALIDIGAAHGILTDAAGAVEVSVHGTRRRVVEVSPLSMRIADAGDDVSVGDEVVLFGDGTWDEPTLQEWADPMQTIGEEIVTRLSAALPRRYTD